MGSIVIVVIVFVLDLIAFSLAVTAALRGNTTIQDESHDQYCNYDKKVAMSFGVGAFFILLASQLIIMFASRCLCCGRGLRPGSSRTWAVILFITCWVMFFVAEACLLVGSVNPYYIEYFGYPDCITPVKHIFGAGAAFIVITGILSELFYLNYSKSSSYADNNNQYRGDTGLRMNNLYS